MELQRLHHCQQPVPQRRNQRRPGCTRAMSPGNTTWEHPRVPPGQTLQVTEHYRIRTTGTNLGGRDECRTTKQGGQVRAFSQQGVTG